MTQPGSTSTSDPDVVTSGFIVVGALGVLIVLRVAFRAALR